MHRAEDLDGAFHKLELEEYRIAMHYNKKILAMLQKAFPAGLTDKELCALANCH